MDAKCPRCDGKATLTDDISKVICGNCVYEKAYDDYIEDMKERVYALVEDLVSRA